MAILLKCVVNNFIRLSFVKIKIAIKKTERVKEMISILKFKLMNIDTPTLKVNKNKIKTETIKLFILLS